jgi:uncharacterized protein (DUF2062 family)
MRRKMRSFLRRLLALDDTPERIAGAFALGVFLAFSPLLGLHAFLGIALSFLFGLNRLAVLMGLIINNPWTLVPIYAAGTYLGGLLVGFPSGHRLSGFEWQAPWSSGFWLQIAGQWPVLKPLIIGSFILSVFASVLSYFVALSMIRHRRIGHDKLL